LLILDLSDLRKKYAEKMEYLATVRDGSEDGELVDGLPWKRNRRYSFLILSIICMSGLPLL
jgi:hypothetical protein